MSTTLSSFTQAFHAFTIANNIGIIPVSMEPNGDINFKTLTEDASLLPTSPYKRICDEARTYPPQFVYLPQLGEVQHDFLTSYARIHGTQKRSAPDRLRGSLSFRNFGEQLDALRAAGKIKGDKTEYVQILQNNVTQPNGDDQDLVTYALARFNLATQQLNERNPLDTTNLKRRLEHSWGADFCISPIENFILAGKRFANIRYYHAAALAYECADATARVILEQATKIFPEGSPDRKEHRLVTQAFLQRWKVHNPLVEQFTLSLADDPSIESYRLRLGRGLFFAYAVDKPSLHSYLTRFLNMVANSSDELGDAYVRAAYTYLHSESYLSKTKNWNNILADLSDAAYHYTQGGKDGKAEATRQLIGTLKKTGMIKY